MEWRDIETAPKDGTVVDLWCTRVHCHGDEQQVRKCNVHWGDMANMFTGEVYPGWVGLGEIYATNEPSHWMPQPDPPKE